MTDLTISDAIDDPMIGLLLEADKISRRSFAQFLESAARVLARSGDTPSFETSHHAVAQSLAHLPLRTAPAPLSPELQIDVGEAWHMAREPGLSPLSASGSFPSADGTWR